MYQLTIKHFDSSTGELLHLSEIPDVVAFHYDSPGSRISYQAAGTGSCTVALEDGTNVTLRDGERVVNEFQRVHAAEESPRDIPGGVSVSLEGHGAPIIIQRVEIDGGRVRMRLRTRRDHLLTDADCRLLAVELLKMVNPMQSA